MQHIFCICLASLLFGCNPVKTKPAEPVTYVAPQSEPSPVDAQDSEYLRIKIVPKGYEISLLEKKWNIQTSEAVDSFMFNNKASINKNKVLVIGNDSLPFFNLLKPVLLKYGISQFAVNNE